MACVAIVMGSLTNGSDVRIEFVKEKHIAVEIIRLLMK
jgi:hypothetical protein